jgi:hypothetical protein
MFMSVEEEIFNGSVYVYDETSVNPKNIFVIIILRGSAIFKIFFTHKQ